MIVVETGWHVVSAALIFLVGLAGALVWARKLRFPERPALFLYAWHTMFSMVYMWFSLNNPADATVYYDQSLIHAGGFKPGTEFVYFFTGIFTRTFGLSYLGAFLVYNCIGSFGLLAFASCVRGATFDKPRLIRQLGWVVLLLPSVSFWSGAIGKDAISFSSACLFLWSGIEVRQRVRWMLFAVLAMFLVRPHIASVMVVAIAGGVVFSRGVGIPLRLSVGFVGTLATFAIIPFALEFAGLGDAQGAADIADYVEQRQAYNQTGGGAIDISSMSLPLQLLTYLYRPLPFEAHNSTSLAASVENVFLILLTLAALGSLVTRHAQPVHTRWMLWLYAGGAWVMLAATTANLGIAARQKWMFLPIMLYLALTLLGRPRRQRQLRPRRQRQLGTQAP